MVGSGGVVWRIRCSNTKLICAVGSRNGTEETKLLVIDFDVEEGEAKTDNNSTNAVIMAHVIPIQRRRLFRVVMLIYLACVLSEIMANMYLFGYVYDLWNRSSIAFYCDGLVT